MGRRVTDGSVEYPFLDRQDHSDDCDVWNGFNWRFLCSCGAAERPEPRVIPEFSNYTLSVEGVVTRLDPLKVLKVENKQHVVRLIGDDGGARSMGVVPLINRMYRDLA